MLINMSDTQRDPKHDGTPGTMGLHMIGPRTRWDPAHNGTPHDGTPHDRTPHMMGPHTQWDPT